MSLYLSGPTKGVDDARQRFTAAADVLDFAGYVVVNPFDVPPICLVNCPGLDSDEHYDCFMRGDIRAMMTCSGLAMLDGWEKSRGARLEHAIAAQVGLPIHPVSIWADWMGP